MDKVVLGFAPTRRAIFSAPAAVVYRGLTAKRLKELNVDFVDIDDVNDEGLLYDDAGMEKIYNLYYAAPFVPAGYFSKSGRLGSPHPIPGRISGTAERKIY